MPRDYNPASWYWRVTGRTDAYDSAAFAYVPLANAGYVAFLADGNVATTIDTEANLRGALNDVNVRFLAESLPPLEEIRPRVVRVRCRLQIATFSVPNATGTAVPWDSELVDPLSMHANSPNPDRIVLPQAGWYYALGGVRFLESTTALPGLANTGMRAAQLRIGAANVVATSRHAPSPADNTEFPVSDYFQASAGDILRMFVEQRTLGTMSCAARITVGRVE